MIFIMLLLKKNKKQIYKPMDFVYSDNENIEYNF